MVGRHRFPIVCISLALCSMLLLVPVARAQYRASIQGVVTDTTGAVIPGATLTLTDNATGQKMVATSSSDGVYNFGALPPNVFTLTVERDGFQKKVLDHLQLIPEQANAVNVELQVGAATQSVTVNAESTTAIDRETANDLVTIDANTVQHFPLFQRDATSLVRLAPGALADGSQQGNGSGFPLPGTQSGASHGGGGNLGSTSSIFATENGPSANTNGQQFENNGFMVDGISTESAVWGGATVITPSMESISEVTIATNAYDAENGRFSGGMTEFTTRSGTNQLHGSLVAQIERPGLNAYQRWNGPASTAPCSSAQDCTPAARGLLKDTDDYNQFGGSIGGPIWRNKLFAFFGYEGQSQNHPSTSKEWLATSQLASLTPSSSIASEYLNFKNGAALGTPISNVSCGDAGLPASNCVAVSGGLNIGTPLTSALGTQDLTYVGSGNPGVGGGLGTAPDVTEYTVSNPTTSNFKQYYGSLDGNAGSNDKLSFKIFWAPATLTNYNGGYGYDLFHHSQTNNAFTAIWIHTFSPTFLNEARANAAGWRYNEIASNPDAPFGLPQDYIPQFGSVALGNFGVSIGGILDQWTYGYKDVATKVFRAHTIKFGFDLTRLYYLNDPVGAPNYTFYNLWDFMNDAPEAEGGGFQATTGIPGGYRNDNRENIYGIFVQDNWKIAPTLTVTAGLRYSYLGPITDKDHNMGVIQFGSGSNLLTGITLRTGIPGWVAQKGNFGPEIGFNWAPEAFKNKLVVRGGYGLNYNQEEIANANNYDGNPPGTNGLPGSSTGPTNINPNILYATSSSPTSLFGYPPNKNAVTTFTTAGLPTAGHANLGGLPNKVPTQYANHYSLEVEYDLGHSLIANLGYLGSSGRHLMYNYDATALGQIMGAPQSTFVNSVNTFGSNGTSNSNMMLAGLKHQFSHGFSAAGQFTWAHSMDTDSGPYFRDPYLYNPTYSLGRSDFDINKGFTLYGNWQPLFFHGSNNLAEKLAGGWSLGGIMTLHSGFGWTPVFNAPHQFYCQTCNYGYQNLRPHYLGGAGSSTSNPVFENGGNFPNPGTANTGPLDATGASVNNQFSNNYFSVPDFSAAITDGSTDFPATSSSTYMPAPGIDRNSFPGPGYKSVDANIAKAFGLPNSRLLGEDGRIEIKADLLNIFNMKNLNPSTMSTNVQNANFGQVTGGLGGRVVDFQARFSF